MAVYTKIATKDIRKIAYSYGLKVSDYKPMEDGISNSNYLLKTDRGTFMLTVIEDGGFRGAKRLAKLLSWFKKHQFFTTRLYPAATGEKVLKWRKKPVLLKKFIPATIEYQLRKKQLKKIGRALARFHAIPAPKFLPQIHVYEQPRFSKVIGSGKDPQYETWLSKKLKEMDGHPDIEAPKGIVHGDLFPDNILFPKNKKPVIIDFEEACFHFLVFDLGMTIIGLCSKGKKISIKLVRALIKGYQKVRPLTEVEKGYLQFFTIYGAVTTSNWRFWKYHIDKPNPERKNKHREMMAIAEWVSKIPNDVFLKKVLPQ